MEQKKSNATSDLRFSEEESCCKRVHIYFVIHKITEKAHKNKRFDFFEKFAILNPSCEYLG